MNLLSAPSMSVLAAAGDEAERSASNGVLILAALVAIATIVVLITTLKLHPFLALIAGSAVLGIVAQYSLLDTLDSFSTGFGSTAAGVGILIALGAMIGKLLADSGGADRIVETITSRVSEQQLPWAMALIAAILGLPLFFEVGVVLLVPVVLLVSRSTGQPLMRGSPRWLVSPSCTVWCRRTPARWLPSTPWASISAGR